MKDYKRIVITGIGPIASPGIGKEALWKGIVSRNIGLELMTAMIDEEVWVEFYLHKVKDFDIYNFHINPKDLDYIFKWKEGKQNRDLNFMLAAVKLALDDSGVDYKRDSHLALVVSHENPCLEQLLWETFNQAYTLGKEKPDVDRKVFLNELFQKAVRTGYETQPFMLLFHIARTFNIHNYSLYVNNACSSGSYAMEVAGDMIRLDRASHVIVVAGDCPDVFKYLWFKKIGMYEEDGKIKPFSSKAKGFVMGEGAVALILTDLETAMEEKSHIYGEYLGGGFRLESWGVTTPMIGSDYFQEAIDDALKISGMGIQDIDLICAHGAGTVSSDYHEARAIMNILGDSNSVPVVAWKSYVGHNLGGSNLLELAILLLSMEHSYVPSIMHNFETDRRIKIDLVKEDRRIPINVALKMCCAMAGYNSAIVIRRLEEKFGQRV